jgi:hypothetical protein
MIGLSKESYVDVKMGESDNAMEYDQELIFRHLFVYFQYLWDVLLLTLYSKVFLPRLSRECA